MKFQNPLKKMVLTQGFGENLVGGDFYSKIGLKNGHNGWDLSAPTGTLVYAVMDGDLLYTVGGQGYGNDIRIRNRDFGLEVVYGHLDSPLVPNGPVKAGDLIAVSDNTGYSTGPHLHFGVRKAVWHVDGSGPYIEDYDNGFYGYFDPKKLFDENVFALPVDLQYGLTPATPGVPSEVSFYPARAYFYWTQKRLMTTREYKALRFGFWDLRTILDPAMYQVWSEMTKPEARKKGIIK